MSSSPSAPVVSPALMAVRLLAEIARTTPQLDVGTNPRHGHPPDNAVCLVVGGLLACPHDCLLQPGPSSRRKFCDLQTCRRFVQPHRNGSGPRDLPTTMIATFPLRRKFYVSLRADGVTNPSKFARRSLIVRSSTMLYTKRYSRMPASCAMLPCLLTEIGL
jgi:hypothetical protein